MKALATLVSIALLAGTGAALANTPLNPPRVYTGVYQPKSTPTRASSLAPQARNKRHAYGAPIQGPIFKRAPSKPSKVPTAKAPRHP
jgi:hypothetical protein